MESRDARGVPARWIRRGWWRWPDFALFRLERTKTEQFGGEALRGLGRTGDAILCPVDALARMVEDAYGNDASCDTVVLHHACTNMCLRPRAMLL